MDSPVVAFAVLGMIQERGRRRSEQSEHAECGGPIQQDDVPDGAQQPGTFPLIARRLRDSLFTVSLLHFFTGYALVFGRGIHLGSYVIEWIEV
jgi:hypothetical protein